MIIFLGFGVVVGVGCVMLVGLFESFNFVFGWVVSLEGLDKVDGFFWNSVNGFSVVMKEGFGYGWFVCVFYFVVEIVVSGLEGYLDKSIGREVYVGNEVFVIGVKI